MSQRTRISGHTCFGYLVTVVLVLLVILAHLLSQQYGVMVYRRRKDTHQGVNTTQTGVYPVREATSTLNSSLLVSSTNVSARGVPPVLWTRQNLLQMPQKFGAARRLPSCYIIGARKAGTSALSQFLAFHPRVWTRAWEDGFFSREDFYVKGLYAYLHTIPRAANGTVNMIKVAEYFHREKVPPRIYALNNKTKVIIIVRDPVVRMLSDYLFLQRYTKQPDASEKSHSIQDLLIEPQAGNINYQWGCMKRSIYAVHYQNWLKTFPKEQILVVNGDSFASNNPAIELRRVESFLGLDSYFTDNTFYFNATKGFYCPTAKGCFGSSKGHTPPALEGDLEKKVRDYLRPWNEKFYRLTGINFGW